MTRRHRLEIARDQFKFSCAHMTVFPDGSKERLHGHNYTVGVALDLPDLAPERMVPFEPIKQAVIALCRQWRERTLLAARNPHFEVIRDDGPAAGEAGELEFRLCGRRYVLPREDALLLSIENVTVEHLAAHVAELLVERLAAELSAGAVTGVEVRVSESPGQGAVCYLPLPRAPA